MHEAVDIDNPKAIVSDDNRCPSKRDHVVDPDKKLSLKEGQIQGSMAVEIRAGSDMSDSSASTSGGITRLITDTERSTYNITDGPLKNKITSAHGSTTPYVAFVKDPTSGSRFYNNGYAQAPCNECYMYVTPSRAEVLSVDKKLVTVKSANFRNNSSVEGKYNVSITEEVSETYGSTWSYQNTIAASQTVRYGVKYFGGETGFSYERTWGESTTKERTLTLGSSSSIEVTLKPGEAVKANLMSSVGTMKVKVYYDGTISGRTLFEHTVNRTSYLCCEPISRVITGSSKISAEEVITVGYYSETDLVLTDPTTGEVISSTRVS